MIASRLRAALACVALAPASFAQCDQWDTRFASFIPGMNARVSCSVVHDDGTGPALYAGGVFTVAGSALASRIARWDGERWQPLGLPGGAADGEVFALASFDDGSGPALYAAGTSTTLGGMPVGRVTRWDGASWSTLASGQPGTNGVILSLVVHDDGSGPALYAGGPFTAIDDVPAGGIAKWDGSGWSAVGGPGLVGFVRDLASYDDGAGPALYATGTFTQIGGVPAQRIARWDGVGWSPLGSGLGGQGESLVVFDDGSGPALCVGGYFETAGGVPASHLARWNGSSWAALGAGTDGAVFALAPFEDDDGPALCVGGIFSTAGGGPASRVARWDGASWSPLGAGIGTATSGSVSALTAFEQDGRPALFAGGTFASAGGQLITNAALWTAAAWSSLEPPGQGLDSFVRALTVHDDGGGPSLYAGGFFFHAGPTIAFNLARWDGSIWHEVGGAVTGPGTLSALGSFDLGAGPRLVIGGNFTDVGGVSAQSIASWNGTSWSPLGAPGDGPIGTVHALARFDDGSGPALYAGGIFTSVAGVPASRIARWDGSSWSALGPGTDGPVYALQVHDDGSGPALYAGGAFTSAGGQPANRLARWDGTSWTAPDAGFNGTVLCLAVHDDGAGSALYAGGEFVQASGVPANRIARWDGATWTGLGTGLTGSGTVVARAMTTFDDGGGARLVVTGAFADAGGVPAKNVASWDGSAWAALGQPGTGLSASGSALAVFDDGADGDADLYVGGDFVVAGSHPSERIAQWHSCLAAPVAFCFGDGTGAPCPCANSGLPGHGCDNSAATGGALLSSTGTTTPDALVLSQTGMLPSSLAIFSQGDAVLGSPVAFGDGVRCVGGALKRMYAKGAVAGSASAPGSGDPSISTRSAQLGDPLVLGDVRFYYVYYRDPVAGFCPSPAGNVFSIGNALRVVW